MFLRFHGTAVPPPLTSKPHQISSLSFRCRRYRDCVVDVANGSGNSMVSSLYFDQLWISVMVCVANRRGMGVTLICEYKVECSQKLYLFMKGAIIGSPLGFMTSISQWQLARFPVLGINSLLLVYLKSNEMVISYLQDIGAIISPLWISCHVGYCCDSEASDGSYFLTDFIEFSVIRKWDVIFTFWEGTKGNRNSLPCFGSFLNCSN